MNADLLEAVRKHETEIANLRRDGRYEEAAKLLADGLRHGGVVRVWRDSLR